MDGPWVTPYELEETDENGNGRLDPLLDEEGNPIVDQDKLNRYQYNGKELTEDLDLNWYAYGARYYDPAIGRFTGVDPISDQFPHVSTYNYAENEPIRHIDLWGLQKYDPQTGSTGPYSNEYIAQQEEQQAYNQAAANTTQVISENYSPRTTEALLATGDLIGFTLEVMMVAEAASGLNSAKGIVSLGDDAMKGFSAAEKGAIKEAKSILNSKGMQTLKSGAEKGTFTEVEIGGRQILFEPGIPTSTGISAMTLENGFVLSSRAFSSTQELTKTVLQEVHRLNFSSVVKTGAASAESAALTTKNAFEFAEKAASVLIK